MALNQNREELTMHRDAIYYSNGQMLSSLKIGSETLRAAAQHAFTSGLSSAQPSIPVSLPNPLSFRNSCCWRAVIIILAIFTLRWNHMGVEGGETTHNTHIVHHSLGSTEDAERSTRDKGWLPVHDACGTDLAIQKVITNSHQLQ